MDKQLLTYIFIGAVLNAILGTFLYLGFDSITMNNFYSEIALKQYLDNNQLYINDYVYLNNKYISEYDLKTYNKLFNYEINDSRYYAINYGLYFKKHNIKYKYIWDKNKVYVIGFYKNYSVIIYKNNLNYIK